MEKKRRSPPKIIQEAFNFAFEITYWISQVKIIQAIPSFKKGGVVCADAQQIDSGEVVISKRGRIWKI